MNKIILIVSFLAFTAMNMYAQNLTVVDVFDAVSKIDGFQEMDYVEDDIKFPAEIGNPKMIIHGNAEPREQVLLLLKKLPEGSLVYDSTDDRGKFDRIFINKITYDLLYVHIGFGGNDSVLILFSDGIRKDIDKYLFKLNNEQYSIGIKRK